MLNGYVTIFRPSGHPPRSPSSSPRHPQTELSPVARTLPPDYRRCGRAQKKRAEALYTEKEEHKRKTNNRWQAIMLEMSTGAVSIRDNPLPLIHMGSPHIHNQQWSVNAPSMAVRRKVDVYNGGSMILWMSTTISVDVYCGQG